MLYRYLSFSYLVFLFSSYCILVHEQMRRKFTPAISISLFLSDVYLCFMFDILCKNSVYLPLSCPFFYIINLCYFIPAISISPSYAKLWRQNFFLFFFGDLRFLKSDVGDSVFSILLLGVA